MTPTSLGFRTDLIFLRFQGWVVDRGSYLFVETPSNPDFYSGNLLYFGFPPRAEDRLPWMRLWRKEFAHNPQVRHVTMAWEGGEGDYVDFLAAGFEIEKSVVMIASKLKAPPSKTTPIEVRPLESDTDWEDALNTQIAGRGEEFEIQAYARFKQKQMSGYREMVSKGHGTWFGAFAEGRQVGNLGVFFDGNLARYQTVATHPSFRRRGVCSKLVFEAGNKARLQSGVKTLVMVADEQGVAREIYRTLGFVETETNRALRWLPNTP